jgi:hypothetical protein
LVWISIQIVYGPCILPWQESLSVAVSPSPLNSTVFSFHNFLAHQPVDFFKFIIYRFNIIFSQPPNKYMEAVWLLLPTLFKALSNWGNNYVKKEYLNDFQTQDCYTFGQYSNSVSCSVLFCNISSRASASETIVSELFNGIEIVILYFE